MCRRLVCLAFACVLGLASTACADLIGWWTFDEGAGAVAKDSSGNGSDGAFVGAPAWVAGMRGGALEFNGSSAVDCGNTETLATTGSITIACWVKPAVLTANKAFVARNAAYVLKAYNTTLRFTTPGVRDHTAVNTVLETNVWQHVAISFQPNLADGAVFYLNGNETCRLPASALPAGTGPFLIGNNQWNEFYTGTIDEVRVYNHALTGPEVLAAMADESYPFAVVTAPKDGALVASRQVTLQWRTGEFATSYNVYFGESKEAVAAAAGTADATFLGSTTGSSMQLGAPGTPSANLLVPGRVYYWRVDAISDTNPASPWKGEVSSFSLQPVTAWEPSPANGVAYTDLNQDLAWQKGLDALFHTIYFGESLDEVSNATTGGWMTADLKYEPGLLKADTTYYWRIDEFVGTATYKGEVWSFHTRPDIAVTDPNLLAWWRLDEGAGLNATDFSGHGYHGVLAGNPGWVDGFLGTALQFDGIDDCVTFGTPAALYQPKNYTYSIWFKVAQNIYGNSGPQYLLCLGSRSDVLFGIEDTVGVNGDLSLHYYDTKPGFQALSIGKIVWDSDEWHMLTATKDAGIGHKIYLDGELKNSDTNLNNDNYNTARTISLGGRVWSSNRMGFFRGAMDDVRIYNKALTDSEIAQLLQGNAMLAQDPSPAQGAVVDIRDAASLDWTAGDAAASHDVYLGTNRGVVAAAGKDSAQYKGNQNAVSFDLAGLVQPGADYYWRIDEVQADGMVVAGNVWKFTVPSYLIVDNFESYTANQDAGEAIYQTWIDGIENGTSSYVGYAASTGGTFGEIAFVHSGGQSMPVDYNNVNSPYYSEISRTWSASQDWTAAGMDTLTLHFRGRIYNGVAPLYVGIEDGSGKRAFVAYGDDSIVTSAQWVRWDIPLAQFAGVNAAKVKKMYIGVGNRDNPTAGNGGRLFIDDIRVTKP